MIGGFVHYTTVVIFTYYALPTVAHCTALSKWTKHSILVALLKVSSAVLSEAKNLSVKFINLEPFPQNFFSKFDRFLMGHANLTKLISLVDKTLKIT